MKRLIFALAVSLSAATLSAQTASTTNVAPRTFTPTSSALEYTARAETADLPTFVVNNQKGQPKSTTTWHIGLFAPLPGSVPTTTRVMPDAFSLLHTEYPWRKGLHPKFR